MDLQNNTGFNSKSDFFRGGKFIVNLSQFEAENRLFIPGHRLLPFLNPSVRPWRIEITASGNGPLRRIRSSAGSETLKPLYSLYGEENFLFLLIDDVQENSSIIIDSAESSYKLYFTAYDLSPLYNGKKPESLAGNIALKLRIDDWEKGFYTAELLQTERNNTEPGEWIERLEKGFRTVLEKEKKLQMVPEVMSDAFVYGGKILLEDPQLSLEDFFEISDINDIADIIAEQKEDPVIAEKKRYLRDKAIKLIKTFTAWLENSSPDSHINPDAVVVLEKQVLMTKRTLIAVLEELNNPFLSEDAIKTMMQVVTESSQLVSKIH